ncbi:MAG TPA: peptide chain release factor N(5)-glutamine methyltransferase [Rhizomicrobium sp.]
MTSQFSEALGRAAQELRAAGIDSARLDARVLFAFAIGIEMDALLGCETVTKDTIRHFESLIARRAEREPLAYITGTKEFWSMSFEVGSGVLVPRPETETLIEQAMRAYPDRDAALNVLDLGTGSGCLLVTFLAHYPRATGVGVDTSLPALAYARRNAIRHRVDTRCTFLNGEWPVADNPAFDVVFANAPYLSESEWEMCEPEIRVFEPKEAFIAGEDGLAALRAIGPALAGQLSPSGSGFIEIGAGQADAVASILAEFGLEVRRAASDLCGVPRCLVIGRAGGGGRLAPKKSVGKGPPTR